MSFIRRISKSQLVRGSILVFIGNNIASFGNFLYNLFMARLLGPEKYGDLGAILSLFVLFGMPLGILNLFIVKTVSSHWGKKDKEIILSFLTYFTPRLFFIGMIASGILLLTSPFFINFLNLESTLPFIIVAVSFILSAPLTLNKAVLQGILSFFYLAVNGIAEVFLKLVVSVILVVLNFGLTGAVLGWLAGGLVGYFLTIIEFKIIFRKIERKETQILPFELLEATIPVVSASLALTVFLNMDIILVRHFFPASLAGEYVALSTLSKIIYYLVGPIIGVMFPIITTRVSGGLSYILPLLGTLVVSLAASIGVIFAFFLFPKLIISILFGARYYGVIPYLGLFSFFIAIYSLDSILTYFLLSVSYSKPIYLLFFISLLQSFFIFLFHNSILEIIWINIATSLLYFVIISFFVWKKENMVIRRILLKIIPRGIYGG